MTRTTVAQARREDCIGKDILLQAWVRTRRDSKGGFSFLELNDGSCFGNVQVLAGQDLPNYESEKVAANLRFVDGLAWSRAGFLAVADVRQRKILRFDSDPRPKVLRESDGGASGLAYDLQGRLYICESEARRAEGLCAKATTGPCQVVGGGMLRRPDT